MRKIFLPLSASLFAFLMITSCADVKNEEKNAKKGSEEQTSKKGDDYTKVNAPGVLRFAESEPYVSLFPPKILDVTSSHIANQIHEGLLAYKSDGSMEIEPRLAESYSISEDELTYTFNLRKGVHFHDDACFSGGKGRELNASDVKFCLEHICSPIYGDSLGTFLNFFDGLIEGTEAFHKGAADEITGIKIVDDYTVEIKLNKKQPTFKYVLALSSSAIFPREAYEKYGEDLKIGAGPFKFAKDVKDKETHLVKNDNYFRVDDEGKSLPYLDSIKVYYIESQKEELAWFKAGKLDILSAVDPERLSEMMQESAKEFTDIPPGKILTSNAEFGTQYYVLNLSKPYLKDVRVRQALNYAIDRKRIIQDVLGGQAFKSGEYGIVPPLFMLKDYPKDSIKSYGYSYDKEKAKKLLAEAGYPNGEGFPYLKLTINHGGRIHNMVAKEISKQLYNTLGIIVNYEVLPFSDKLEQERYGRGDMFRSAWIGDYPDPETFLTIAYGKPVPNDPNAPSYPNSMRYKNAEYDRLFEEASQLNDSKERSKLFAKAEQIMLKDAPLIVLWYVENRRFHYSYLRNFEFNALSQYDFSDVYKKAWTSTEWKKQHNVK